MIIQPLVRVGRVALGANSSVSSGLQMTALSRRSTNRNTADIYDSDAAKPDRYGIGLRSEGISGSEET
jgi:hypothetical protein